ILGIALAAVIGVWFATKGSSKKAVPAVVGLGIDDAVVKLQDDGFRIAIQRRASPKTAGTVVGQVPAAGVPEPKGSTVSLQVSRGRTLHTVPNAVGEHQTT